MLRWITLAAGLLCASTAYAEMDADDCKALAPHLQPLAEAVTPLNQAAAQVIAASALVGMTEGEYEFDDDAAKQASQALFAAAQSVSDQAAAISSSLDGLMTAIARRCGLIE